MNPAPLFGGVFCYVCLEDVQNELEVSEGVAQAKLYAQKLHLQTSYAANGKAIYQICHKTGIEGLVETFPTPDELWDKTFGEPNEWLERFNAVPFEDINRTKQARYYQELAVNSVMEAIANDKKRVLLTLATGTGKTAIAFQIAWKLFKDDIKQYQIDLNRICTYSNPNLFNSYRRDKTNSRQWSCIYS